MKNEEEPKLIVFWKKDDQEIYLRCSAEQMMWFLHEHGECYVKLIWDRLGVFRYKTSSSKWANTLMTHGVINFFTAHWVMCLFIVFSAVRPIRINMALENFLDGPCCFKGGHLLWIVLGGNFWERLSFWSSSRSLHRKKPPTVYVEVEFQRSGLIYPIEK